MKKLMFLFMCLMVFAGSASAWMINVDFSNSSSPFAPLFSGQGVFQDPGNNVWSGAEGGQENLVYSDGTSATGIGIWSGNAWGYSISSITQSMLTDGRFVLSGGAGPDASSNMTWHGLQPNTSYWLVVYGSGDGTTYGSKFTVNGVTKTTTGSSSNDYIEGGNFVHFGEVVSSSSGEIAVLVEVAPGATRGGISGMQLASENPDRGKAHTPTPANNDNNIDKTVLTQLSWRSPEQDEEGNFVGDLNIVSVDGYNVWFGTAEPNEVLDTPTFVAAPTQSLPVTLDYSTTYYWRVDTQVTWDSNDFTGTASTSNVVEGPLWQFTTLSAYYAPELTFDNVITVPGLLPANLSATVSGNTDPITSVVFELLTAGASVTNTTVDNENPTATLTTATAGTYLVKLTISDGTTPVEKVAEVTVYSDACAAKKVAPSGWTANYYDTNGDCVVNVADFADLALEWLDNSGMAAQETYGGDIFVQAWDIQVEAEAAIFPTDPNYAAGNVGVIYHLLASGDQRIGNFGDGSLLTYEVNVLVEGDYTLYLRAFHEWDREVFFHLVTNISFDGDPFNDTLEYLAWIGMAGEGTAGAKFYLYSAPLPVHLTAGTHLIRLSNAAQWDIGPDVFGFVKN